MDEGRKRVLTPRRKTTVTLFTSHERFTLSAVLTLLLIVLSIFGLRGFRWYEWFGLFLYFGVFDVASYFAAKKVYKGKRNWHDMGE